MSAGVRSEPDEAVAMTVSRRFEAENEDVEKKPRREEMEEKWIHCEASIPMRRRRVEKVLTASIDDEATPYRTGGELKNTRKP